MERSLQSRVVQLESEGRRLAGQLAKSQTSLREERASHTRDRDNLMSVSNNYIIVKPLNKGHLGDIEIVLYSCPLFKMSFIVSVR